MARRYISYARRSKTSLTFLMVDIDHFKQINTKFGHLTGDMILTDIASLLKDSVRGSDAVIRYGGDEFLVILPMTKPSEAQVFVARVQASLRGMELASPEFGPCTLSMGIAESPKHGTTVSSLLAAADTALYKAKRAGRNAVEVADG